MGLLSFILKVFLPTGILIFLESKISNDFSLPIFEKSSLIPSLPKAFALPLFINCILSTIVLINLGVKVSQARSQYKEKAIKDGDKEAEERFSYPKLYAEGFSENAKKFNCVQRGHQQALETYTNFIILSLIGGISFPLTTSIAGLIWIIARFSWAKGYATGDPGKRYNAPTSYGIWISLIILLVAASATCVKMLL